MRRALLIPSLSLLLFLSTGVSAEPERSTFAFPGAMYLEGVGPIYGGAAGIGNVFKEGATLAAFKTFGKVKGGGLALLGLPVLDGRGRLAAGLGILEEAEFTTQYGRGYEQRLLVEQAVEGYGAGARLDHETIPGRLDLSAGYSFSSVAFVAYKNRTGRRIPISLKSLHDVEAHAFALGFTAKAHEEDPRRLRLKGSFTAVMGRAAQSDIGLLRFVVDGMRLFWERFRVSYTAQISNAVVIREAGPGAVDGECQKIADPALRLDCQQLEPQITDFVVESNRAGTALPLGGSKGLRSYRELRFKAAHTALSGVEAGWKPVLAYPAEIVAFYELGHASDKLAALYSGGRWSAGAGLRVTLKNIPIRAEFARGQEGNAAFLTLGAPW